VGQHRPDRVEVARRVGLERDDQVVVAVAELERRAEAAVERPARPAVAALADE
jgi:hypothetical protein